MITAVRPLDETPVEPTRWGAPTRPLEATRGRRHRSLDRTSLSSGARGRSTMRGAVDLIRASLALLMFMILFWTLSWLQGRYADSDHRKATAMVRDYRAEEGGPSITEAILQKHPNLKAHDISWSSSILSSCLGHVRVLAYVPQQDQQPAANYAFDVRLTAPSIHPTDPATVKILQSLTATTTPHPDAKAVPDRG